MLLTPVISDVLSELLKNTAQSLEQKLIELTGEFTSDRLDVCRLIPPNLKSDPRYIHALSKYQEIEEFTELNNVEQEQKQDQKKELTEQLLSLLGEWQSAKLPKQIKDISPLFERKNLANVFNQQETINILTDAQKKHRLLVLVAPPKVSPSCPSSLQYDLEIDLPEELNGFLNKYYPPNSNWCPVRFYNDYFQRPVTTADIHELQQILNGIPTVTLYSIVSDHKVYIHVCFWMLDSNTVFKLDLPGWDWEIARDAMIGSGKTDTQSIRAIRQIIVTIHEFLAACFIDAYFLNINPVYQPRLYTIEKDFGEAGLTPEAIAPYLEMFQKMEQEQLTAYREETKEISEVQTTLLRKGNEWKCINTLIGHQESIYGLLFHPHNHTLISASHDQLIKIWDLNTGNIAGNLRGNLWVHAIAISQDGELLAAANGDQTFTLWNLINGNELRTVKAHTGDISALAFIPNATMLVTASWDYSLKLWNTKTGNKIRTMMGHLGLVNCVAVSQDGELLASGSHDQTIKIWNLKTGQEIMTFTGHSSSVNSIAFSPDGQTLASGSDDRTIKLWNLKTGYLMQTFSGYLSAVNSVAFSPDGEILASGSDDKTIKLWSLRTGQAIRMLTGHTDSVYVVAFSPDGQTLASGSSDTSIRLWQCEE